MRTTKKESFAALATGLISSDEKTLDVNTTNEVNSDGVFALKKSPNEKKEWPNPAQVISNDRKSSAERLVDHKIRENKATDRPVYLNVGGTRYQVCWPKDQKVNV